jgi:anti-sigma factor RsiW
MNCAETHPLLHAYTDGELDLVRSLEVEQHLRGCAACESQKASLQSLGSLLRNSDLAYRAPDSLRKKVRQIAPAPERGTRSRADNVSPLWKWLAIGATAFAVFTLVLRTPGNSDNSRLLDDAVAGHVRSLMAGHLMDVASTDQHTVKPWFNGKLDFAPDVKDFAAQDFPLVGGRLDYLDHRAVAALVYRRNKHFINVFVWPASSPNEPQPADKNLRGYWVINRQVNGLQYCLVSDLNEKELGELADLLGK